MPQLCKAAWRLEILACIWFAIYLCVCWCESLSYIIVQGLLHGWLAFSSAHPCCWCREVPVRLQSVTDNLPMSPWWMCCPACVCVRVGGSVGKCCHSTFPLVCVIFVAEEKERKEGRDMRDIREASTLRRKFSLNSLYHSPVHIFLSRCTICVCACVLRVWDGLRLFVWSFTIIAWLASAYEYAADPREKPSAETRKTPVNFDLVSFLVIKQRAIEHMLPLPTITMGLLSKLWPLAHC